MTRSYVRYRTTLVPAPFDFPADLSEIHAETRRGATREPAAPVNRFNLTIDAHNFRQNKGK